jgi:hypothetical protein
VWRALAPAGQARVIGLVVERVDYAGGRQKVAVTFHPAGIKTLAEELACQVEDESASRLS